MIINHKDRHDCSAKIEGTMLDCPSSAYHLSSFTKMIAPAYLNNGVQTDEKTKKWKCNLGHITTTTHIIKKDLLKR